MKNLYSIKKVITLFALLFLAGCSQEKDFIIEQNHGKIDFEEKSFNELLTLPTFNAAYQKVAKKKGVFLTEDNARTALEDQHGFTITKDVPVKIFTAEDGTIFYTILIEREIEEELKFENLIIKVENEVTTAGIFKYTMADLAIKLESHDAYKFDIIKTEYTDLNIEGRTIAAINSDGAICITSETMMCNAYEAGYDPIHNVHGSCLAYAATHNFSNILIDSQTQCYGYEGGGGSTSNGGTIIPTTTNPSHGPIININSNSVITSPTLCVNCVTYTPTFQMSNLGLTASEMDWLNNNLSTKLQIQLFLNSNNTQEDYDFVNNLIDVVKTESIADSNAVGFVLKAKTQNKINNDLDDTFLLSVDHLMDLDVANYIANNPTDPLWIHFSIQCAVLRANHPDWSDLKIYWEASKEMVHITLDVLGLVPVFGEVADLTNGALYLIEGDGVNASLSVASAVPIGGWAAVGVKYAVKVNEVVSIGTKIKLVWKVTGDVISFGSRNQLRKVLGLLPGNPLQAHHLIPWSSQSKMAVQRAAKAGSAFHMNEALNGIAVAAWRNQPNHNIYNNIIDGKLDAFRYSNPNATPQECYEFLTDLIQDIRTWVINNPNSHLNNIVLP